jgi:GNAT superfamily N-acetyltransferase
MKIEKMTLADIPSVTGLATQLGYPNAESDIALRFCEIQKLEGHELLVAKLDSHEIAGWIQINQEAATLLVGPRADIAALVVDEKCRSLGIGKALINHAEAWARKNGLELVRVKSNVAREAAHRFYQREGFVLLKTSHMFSKILADQ